jgi:hypothetical protein
MKCSFLSKCPGTSGVIRASLVVILGTSFSMPLYGQDTTSVFRVKYLSAEHVYVDAGTNDGVRTGTPLMVQRHGNCLACLEAVYVSKYSSSCCIIDQKKPIHIGDTIVLADELQGVQKHTAPDTDPRQSAPTVGMKSTRRSGPIPSPASVSGSLVFQLYSVNDKTDADLDLTQKNIRTNVHVRNIWNKGYSFRMRMRTRRTVGTKSGYGKVREAEWINNIYELSFHHDSERSRIGFSVGRIIANPLRGVGYIDGVLLQGKITDALIVGVFAGAQPDWHDADFQTSLQKYGASVRFTNDHEQHLHLASTLALAGEYHSSTLSREFIYVQNDVRFGTRVRLYQSATLDVNRDWRKEKSGKTISLSALSVTLRYRPLDWLGAQLSYDTHTNYWTYELKSAADSLFDDVLRRGFRGIVTFRLPWESSVSSSFGYRKRDSDPDESSFYSFGFQKSNATKQRINLHLRYSGFSNLYDRGSSGSLGFGKYFQHGIRFEFEYGRYRYESRSHVTKTARDNDRFQVRTRLLLSHRIFLSGDYQYDVGDDMDSQRICIDVGYRF